MAGNVGVWVETSRGEIKEANFGVITAARGTGGAEGGEVLAFLPDPGDAARLVRRAFGFRRGGPGSPNSLSRKPGSG